MYGTNFNFHQDEEDGGEVRLQFRLRDGRDVDLYHKSERRASLADLAKFNDDGSVRPRVTVFSRELKEGIDVEMEAMRRAYARLRERMERAHINGEMFESEVERELHPELAVRKKATVALTERFERFIEDAYRDGMFGEGARKHYHTVLGR